MDSQGYGKMLNVIDLERHEWECCLFSGMTEFWLNIGEFVSLGPLLNPDFTF
jgi:hypothetical protein